VRAIESPGLLANLAIALLAAMVGAAVAVRLGQSTMVGFIVAGIVIGPYTPGFVGDVDIVQELADIGVIFLMFAIGARISFADLASYRWVAVVGGSVQVLLTIGVGTLVGLGLGWGLQEALFLGAVASNSSSTVLAKVLGERGEADSEHGHISLAWSTVQDLWTLVLIVVLGSSASPTGVDVDGLARSLGLAALFLAILVLVGLLVVPRFFELLAGFRSRELFVLGVVGVALGIAYLGTFFGISLALGAFLAGLLVSRSDLSHRVVAETLPFRDIFAGLFFVSVGMLVDPGFVLANLPLLAVGVALIVPVKGAIVALITRAFGYPPRLSLLVGVALAQSAEFSFLLASVGLGIAAISQSTFDLLIASAAVSIALSPLLRWLAEPAARRLDRWRVRGLRPEPVDLSSEGRRIAVVCGYGRVGRLLVGALDRRGFASLVIDPDPRATGQARRDGHPVITGPAENPFVLEAARLSRAAVLVVALPDPLATRLTVETAHRSHPRLPIVARTSSIAERDVLERLGASEVVVGEFELGLQMTRFSLQAVGISNREVDYIVNGLRER
jgi:CPA2 family monovalent cation:H+ antiporter-2